MQKKRQEKKKKQITIGERRRTIKMSEDIGIMPVLEEKTRPIKIKGLIQIICQEIEEKEIPKTRYKAMEEIIQRKHIRLKQEEMNEEIGPILINDDNIIIIVEGNSAFVYFKKDQKFYLVDGEKAKDVKML
jgi:hypothetical protein